MFISLCSREESCGDFALARTLLYRNTLFLLFTYLLYVYLLTNQTFEILHHFFHFSYVACNVCIPEQVRGYSALYSKKVRGYNDIGVIYELLNFSYIIYHPVLNYPMGSLFYSSQHVLHAYKSRCKKSTQYSCVHL